jgi:hypothetical protein
MTTRNIWKWGHAKVKGNFYLLQKERGKPNLDLTVLGNSPRPYTDKAIKKKKNRAFKCQARTGEAHGWCFEKKWSDKLFLYNERVCMSNARRMQEWKNQKNKLLSFALTDAKWIDQFMLRDSSGGRIGSSVVVWVLMSASCNCCLPPQEKRKRAHFWYAC